MNRIRNRWVAGLLAATMAFAVAFGAAASLGLTVDTLSADQVAITACDTAIASAYSTAYEAAIDGYEVDDVTLSGIAAACDGFDFKVTIADATGTSLAEQLSPNAVLVSGSLVFDFSGDNELASGVGLIAVSITQ